VGPLIHPEHRDRVLGYIEIGKKHMDFARKG